MFHNDSASCRVIPAVNIVFGHKGHSRGTATPTSLICGVTVSGSQKSRANAVVAILELLTTSERLWQINWRQCRQLMNFSTVSKSENNVSVDVRLLRNYFEGDEVDLWLVDNKYFSNYSLLSRQTSYYKFSKVCTWRLLSPSLCKMRNARDSFRSVQKHLRIVGH